LYAAKDGATAYTRNGAVTEDPPNRSMNDQPAAPKSGTAVAPARLYAQALDHFQAGRYQLTAQLLSQALRAQPNNPMFWYLAGATAKALRQPDNAEQCWRKAVALAPGFAEAHYELAVLLQENKRVAEAIPAYRLALQMAPRDAQVLNNLGSALATLGQLDEALQRFDEALAVKPDYAKALHNRGRTLANLGRLEEAQQSLYAAIDHAPAREKARFYRSLAFLKKFSRDDAALPAMEALGRNMETLSAAEQMELNFALGKAYGDIGERERSFAHFLAGNKHKRAQTVYDEAASVAQLLRIEVAYTPARMAAGEGAGHPSELPVFILGMPRSGSSLVEQVLASHPRVHGAGECEEFKFLAAAMRLPGGGPLLPDGIAGLPAAGLRQLGQDYQERMLARAPHAGRVTDKTLSNFQHVGLIHLALPKARIIHTRRDPVDTCLSCFSHIFNGDHAYSYDLSELGRYWRAYDRLMAHWRSVLPPGVMLEVRYEDMVEDLEGQSRRLLAHCGLDWSDACLEFHKTQRPVYTASVTQVREPLYRTSVQKWRAYEHLLQPLLEALAI
jgi:tetratricopeptide (TPR) repeat protein